MQSSGALGLIIVVNDNINPEFRLPRNDEHTAIVGRNGTGKTVGGVWILSEQDFKKHRWIITDYKREEIFNKIRNIREIGFEIPKKPGLYVIRLRKDLDEETERWLWKIYDKGKTGLFVDEGYMIPGQERGAFQAILTQGRSKRIPVITLSQRPVRVPLFVFSEASHVVSYDLSQQRDKKRLEEIVPDGFSEWVPQEFGQRLPPFHARWYNVKQHASYVLKPVPKPDELVQRIDDKLVPIRKWF